MRKWAEAAKAAFALADERGRLPDGMNFKKYVLSFLHIFVEGFLYGSHDIFNNPYLLGGAVV